MVIVGAGPAGLTIASGLRQAARDVVVIDEWESAGGCLNWEEASRQSEPFRSLATFLDVRTASVAWAAFDHADGYDVMLSEQGQASNIVATTLILATGTTDVGRDIAGVTLPGVMTERAFRVLVTKHGVIPGASIALVGGVSSGRLAAETSRWNLHGRITNVSAKTLVSINGADRVESLSLTNGTTIDADTVVLSLGEAPDLQLAGMLGVQTKYDPERRSWYAQSFNPRPNLYLAGGALLGQATLPEVQKSAEDVLAAILAAPGSDR
jgi:hypothetical protein